MRMPFWEFGVLFENVPLFPTELLERYLQHLYNLSEVYLCPTQLGSRCRRPRKFILLTLKVCCHLSRGLSCMPEVFKRVATQQFSLREYMVAIEGELASELRWGRARSGNPHATTFEECLLPFETVRLTIFRDRHDVGKCVCNLSQNPEFTRAAGREMELHTLVRNSVVLWSCEHRRWLTGREMLLAN